MMPPIDATAKEGRAMRQGFIAGCMTTLIGLGRITQAQTMDYDRAFDNWLAAENERRGTQIPYHKRGKPTDKETSEMPELKHPMILHAERLGDEANPMDLGHVQDTDVAGSTPEVVNTFVTNFTEDRPEGVPVPALADQVEVWLHDDGTITHCDGSPIEAADIPNGRAIVTVLTDADVAARASESDGAPTDSGQGTPEGGDAGMVAPAPPAQESDLAGTGGAAGKL